EDGVDRVAGVVVRRIDAMEAAQIVAHRATFAGGDLLHDLEQIRIRGAVAAPAHLHGHRETAGVFRAGHAAGDRVALVDVDGEPAIDQLVRGGQSGDAA